jgi:hypothetical protein
MAFLATNLLYWLLIYGIVRRHYAFALSARNVKLMAAAAAAGAAAVFLAPVVLPRHPLVLGSATAVLGGVLCFGAVLHTAAESRRR